MKTVLLFFVVTLMMIVVQGKHMHPRSVVRLGEVEVEDDQSENMNIDTVRNIRPNRFVPINSVLFFKTFPPCEAGLERDLLGVCREVWN